MKIGDTVRNIVHGALFEVVALPSLEIPQLTVRYKDAPSQIRRVDPTQYVVVAPEKKRQKRGGLDRAERGGHDRSA
jgi:hypothetical protein